MRHRTVIVLALAVVIMSFAGCASSPPMSSAFQAALRRAEAKGESEVTGWYWICSVEDSNGRPCPHPHGPVEASVDDAAAGRAAHIREHPTHADATTVKSVVVDTSEAP